MPPYVSCSLTFSPLSLRHVARGSAAWRVRRLQLARRTASTTSVLAAQIIPDCTRTLEGEPDEVRDLLRRARSVLMSVSRLQGKANSGNESVLDPLTLACDALSTVDWGSELNVTVYSEEDTPARDLVTVLLEDPLSSDGSFRSAIYKRWATRERLQKHVLRFRQSNTDPIDEDTMTLPSPFFGRFPHPVTLKELRPCVASVEVVRHLLEADILVLVVSPFHSLSPSLLSALSRNSHAVLVVDGALNPTSPSADRLRSQVADKYGCDPARVLLIDTARARRGAVTLSADPSSAAVVRTFQEDILASGVPTLLRTLTDTISLGPVRLHADTGIAMTKLSVAAAKDVIRQTVEETREARGRSSALRENALEEGERGELEILGGDTDLATLGEQGRVARGVERAAADVRPVIDGLTWYRLPFVVDDVSVRVDSAVERAFAREFENEVMYHTGRLSSIQAHLVSRTTSLLSSLSVAFNSPVLQNHLAQLTSAPSFPITPTSPSPSSSSSSPTSNNSTLTPALLAPLRTRTAQLAHATRALHLSAQRLLLVTFSTTTVSSISSAFLYVNTTLDAASAVGAGLLGILAGLRWAVGRWTRAREKWWNAYTRVGDGLARDMRSVLRVMLDKQVCIVPDEACKGLQRLVERREREIGEVEDEVEKLEVALESSEEGTKREKNKEDEKRRD